MDFTATSDELAESDFWIDAVMVLAGFLAPAIVRNVVEGRLGQDLPAMPMVWRQPPALTEPATGLIGIPTEPERRGATPTDCRPGAAR